MKANLFELEIFISKILRVGVIVAGLLMLVGWVSGLQFNENPMLKFQEYHPETLGILLKQMYQAGEWGELTSFVGLFVLISLPMVRVFMTAVLFMKRREFLMASLAGFVLIALMVSFSLGLEL